MDFWWTLDGPLPGHLGGLLGVVLAYIASYGCMHIMLSIYVANFGIADIMKTK